MWLLPVCGTLQLHHVVACVASVVGHVCMPNYHTSLGGLRGNQAPLAGTLVLQEVRPPSCTRVERRQHVSAFTVATIDCCPKLYCAENLNCQYPDSSASQQGLVAQW